MHPVVLWEMRQIERVHLFPMQRITPMRKRTIGRLAVVATCVAGLLGATAVYSAAQAAPPSGFLTVYVNQFQGGDQRLLTNTITDFRSIGFNDATSSVYNQTGSAWVLAEASFFGARIFCLRPGEGVDDLHSSTLVFQDRISSALNLGTPSCAGYPAFYG